MSVFFNNFFSKDDGLKITPEYSKKPFNKRIHEAERIIAKYPDRIPIICQRSDKNVPIIDKEKFLVPKDLTLGQFMYVIRKRISLPPEKAIFLFINNKLFPTSSLIYTIYERNRSSDKFLYVSYSSENTFG